MTVNEELDFVLIHAKIMKVIILSEALFENSGDLNSQLGSVIPLDDESHKANIVHYVVEPE